MSDELLDRVLNEVQRVDCHADDYYGGIYVYEYNGGEFVRYDDLKALIETLKSDNTKE